MTTPLAVTISEVPDAPSVVVGAASGTEDQSMALDITVNPTNGVAVDSVTLTGVPSGSTITLADGSTITSTGADITLTEAQVDAGLQLTAPSDYSGTFEVGVTAVSVDGGTSSSTFEVAVNPDADMPTLTATSAGGQEDTPIDLSISTAVTDTDGSESIESIVITGVPADATLSAGTYNATTGEWTLTEAQLDGLQLNPADNFNGTINLQVTSNIIDEATGLPSDTASVTTPLDVTVSPVGDAPTIVIGGGTGDEDTQIPISITVTPVGGEEVTSVTISGLPDGATLSAGTYDATSDTWTLDTADLDGLTMTPELHYSGTPTLTVTAVTDEGGSASTDAPVTVIAVADAPPITLDIGDPTTTEGGFIPDIDAFPHDISNIVMYLQDGNGDIEKIKIEDFPGGGLDDVNDLGLQEYIETNFPGTEMVGLTVKAGDNHTPGFGPGEGELVYVADGMTQSDLPVAAHVDEEHSYNDTLDGLDPSPTGGGSDGGLTYPVDITTSLVDTDGSEVLSLTLTNVPDGVTFSAGTNNGDGTWDVPVDALDGLTMDVPAGTDAFTLGATATSTEQSNQDSASNSATASVGGAGTNPDPTVEVGDVVGNEDGSVALDITVTNTETVTITNVGDGTLSAGTDNGDGSWTLTPAQLEGLTFTPDADWSGEFNIGVTATAADGSTATDVGNIAVNPDADAPTLTASAASGDEDTAIDLSISTSVTDTDGSESIESVVISGVPSGASLNAGTDNGDGTWTLSEDDLSGLQITPADDFNGSFDLTVTTNIIDTATGLPSDTASTSTTLGVTVAPVGDAPTIVIGGSGTEDVVVPISISVTPEGGETLETVTITGLPDGATLSAGTYDAGSDTWTLEPGDLSGLTMSTVEHYSGTPTITVTAVTDEGGTSSTTADIPVVAVADAPPVTIDIGEGTDVGGATGSVSMENMGQESAAYENTIGWYVKGENGEPTEGGIIWADTK